MSARVHPSSHGHTSHVRHMHSSTSSRQHGSVGLGITKAARPSPREAQKIAAPRSETRRAKNGWLKKASEKFSSLKSTVDPRVWEKIKDSHFQHARFIGDLSRLIHRAPQLPTATAITYFALHSIHERNSRFSPFIVALASFFLASKVEETYYPAPVVLKFGYARYHKQPLVENSTEYTTLLHDLLDAEVELLMTLSFDLEVEHPYAHLLKDVQTLSSTSNLSNEQSQKLCSTAWSLVNDSLHTLLCVQFSSRTIALTAIYMAARHLGLTLRGASPLQPSMSPQTPQSPQSPESPGESPEHQAQQRGVDDWWRLWSVDLSMIRFIEDKINLAIERLKEIYKQEQARAMASAKLETEICQEASPQELALANVPEDSDASSPVAEPDCPASSDPSPRSPQD